MARSYPAQSMGQVSVLLHKVVNLKGGKGTMKTHYNFTLDQAMRNGVIRLNDDGKITEVLDENAKIDIPKGMLPEDVFAITPAPAPE